MEPERTPTTSHTPAYSPYGANGDHGSALAPDESVSLRHTAANTHGYDSAYTGFADSSGIAQDPVVRDIPSATEDTLARPRLAAVAATIAGPSAAPPPRFLRPSGHSVGPPKKTTGTSPSGSSSTPFFSVPKSALGRKGKLRATLQPFLYNAQISVLLLPCLVLMLMFGGQMLITVSVVGLLATHLLHSINLPEVAYMSFWATLGISLVVIWLEGVYAVRSATFAFFLLNNFSVLAMCLGMWGSLHNTWFLREFRDMLPFTEQMLFSCTPLPAAVTITWGVAAASGLKSSPYVLTAVLYAALYLCIYPRTPSFPLDAETDSERAAKKDAADSGSDSDTANGQRPPTHARTARRITAKPRAEDAIVGSVCTVLHLAVFCIAPMLYHLLLHRRRLVAGGNLPNLLILVFMPALLLVTLCNAGPLASAVGRKRKPIVISSKQSYDETPGVPGGIMWWMDLDQSETSSTLPRLLTLAAVALSLAFEYRVIIHSYSHYLAVSVYGGTIVYTLLTVCILAALGTLALMLTGEQQPKTAEDSRRRGIKLCLHTSAICGAIAVGLPMLLMPFVLVAAETAASFYFSRRIHYYAFFVLAFTLSLTWFMRKNFWFLSVSLGTITLKQLSAVVGALFVVALALPGLALARVAKPILGVLLVGYALSLAAVECVLVLDNGAFDTPVYGSYLVVGTAAVGCFTAYRLKLREVIDPVTYWLLCGVNVGKLSLLITDSFVELMHGIGVAVAIAPLFVLYNAKATRLALRQRLGASGKPKTTQLEPGVMTPTKGLLHAVSIVGALYMARKTVLLEILRLLFQDLNLSDANITSCFLITSALAVTPICFTHLAHLPALRRANSVAIVLACLYALIQPDVDLWNSAEVLSYSDDEALGTSHAKWPAWLLFLSLAVLITSVASFLPLPRLLFALTLGSCTGLYVCGVYMPSHTMLYVVYLVTFNVTAILLVYLLWPSRSSGAVVATTFGLLVALLPVSYMMEGQLFGFAPRRRGQDLLLASRMSLLGVHCGIHFIIALAVKMSREGTASRTAHPRPTAYRRHGVGAADEVSSSVYIGNIAAPLSFCLGCVLHFHYMDGGHTGILVLAPILLLLSKDRSFFSGLTEQRRYFPLVAVTVGYLVVATVHTLFLRPMMISSGMALPAATDKSLSGGWTLMIQACMLLLVMPSHIFLLMFLWSRRAQDEFLLICVGPLNVLALVLAEITTLQLLAGLGAIGTVVELYGAHQIRKHGLDVL